MKLVTMQRNTVGMRLLEIQSPEAQVDHIIRVHNPKTAREMGEALLSLADKMETYNNKHFPTVTITKVQRRTKGGQVRQWLVCKKCGEVKRYDYTPYSLSSALAIGSCKCGSFCLNDEWDRKRFREITAKEAKALKKKEADAFFADFSRKGGLTKPLK